MKTVARIPNTKFKLINVNDLFKESHSKHHSYCYEHHIKDRKTHRKIQLHTYILDLCNIIIANNGTDIPVLYINTEDEHLEPSEIKVFDKFKKMIPCLYIEKTIFFSEYLSSLQRSTGAVEDCVMMLTALEQNREKRYHFSRIEKFCKTNELTFLDNAFFADIKTKSRLI